MKNDIICIGGANVDLKLKSQQQLILNSSNPVISNQTFGGVARNVAHNLAKVTSKIHLQCVVGDDVNGRALLKHMQSLGVNTQYSQVLSGKRTSQYYALINELGELFIGLADMDIYEHLQIEFITSAWDGWDEQTLIFLDTNLPSTLIDLILKKAAMLNIKVCIDPVSAKKAKRIPYCLDPVFLIKPDVQEASALTNMTIDSIRDCMAAGLKLKERGAKNIVISLGKLGYVLINDTHQVHVKAEEVSNVIDVSGAGDSFIAGILYGLQRGKTVYESCHIGSITAAQTIQSVETVI